MSGWVFPPPDPVALPVRGGGRYPVRRIFCIGRNYAAHAAELGNEVVKEAPWFFTKTPAMLAQSGSLLTWPRGTSDYHHEVELVAALGEGGAVWGWGVGLDMTRRDVQAAMKEKRLPWDAAKDGEAASVFGPLTPAAEWDGPGSRRITLEVNGALRQDAPVSDMIWPVPAQLAHLAGLYDLGPGDIVMTGTPAGVAAVAPGDRLVGRVEGLEPVVAEFAR